MNFYDPKLQELYEAGLQLRPFLRASSDSDEFETIEEARAWIKQQVNMTDAQKLRLRAEEADAKDAAIIRFRRALEALADA